MRCRVPCEDFTWNTSFNPYKTLWGKRHFTDEHWGREVNQPAQGQRSWVAKLGLNPARSDSRVHAQSKPPPHTGTHPLPHWCLLQLWFCFFVFVLYKLNSELQEDRDCILCVEYKAQHMADWLNEWKSPKEEKLHAWRYSWNDKSQERRQRLIK